MFSSDETSSQGKRTFPWTILFWVVVILIAMFMLTSGSKDKEPVASPPPIPVYVAVIGGRDTIVYSTGDIAREYKLDDGNIVDAETEAVVVEAKNVQHAVVIEVTPEPVETVSPDTDTGNASSVIYPCNAIVNGEGVRIRTQTSTSSAVIVELKRGTVVKVLDDVGGWYEVEYDGQKGYISATYILIQNG